jgi:hypothetical protein
MSRLWPLGESRAGDPRAEPGRKARPPLGGSADDRQFMIDAARRIGYGRFSQLETKFPGVFRTPGNFCFSKRSALGRPRPDAGKHRGARFFGWRGDMETRFGTHCRRQHSDQ